MKNNNRNVWRASAAAVLVLLTFGAQAQGLYRWVDEKGRVHYTDRPPEKKQNAKQEQKLDKEKIAPRENIEAQKALANTLKDQAASKREQEEAQKRAQERAEKERIRERDCNLAQEAVRQLTSGQRLAVVGEKGERQVLDEKAVAARLEVAKEQETKACAPLPPDEPPKPAEAPKQDPKGNKAAPASKGDAPKEPPAAAK